MDSSAALHMVDLMDLETSLPYSLWDYTAITASYVLNHTLNSSGQKTHFEHWMGYTDSLEHLYDWAYEVHPHVDDEDEYDKDMKRCFLI